MGNILRIGYRHIEAIKSQTISTLGSIFASYHSFSMEQWLRKSAPQLLDYYKSINFPEEFLCEHQTRTLENYALILNCVVSNIAENNILRKSGEPWQKRLDEAWQNRNKIAHGYEPVEVSFYRFLQVHYDVFSSMKVLAQQCLENQFIEI